MENSEDWLILKRKDNHHFDSYIGVRVTNGIKIEKELPYISIYHYPLDYSSLDKIEITKTCSETRVISAQINLLICNDFCTISRGSCGAPYVEKASSCAIGFHLYGMSVLNSKVPAQYQGTTEDRPCGLHFVQGSSVVQALRKYEIL